MPAYDHTLEDFYAMAQAAKPALEAAIAGTRDGAQKRSLGLALQLITGVREFAKEIDSARRRKDAGLIEKLSHHLVRSCTPAPGHFLARRHRGAVMLRPLVREARDWIRTNLPEMAPVRGDLIAIEPRLWPDVADDIEAAGLTIAR